MHIKLAVLAFLAGYWLGVWSVFGEERGFLVSIPIMLLTIVVAVIIAISGLVAVLR